MATLHSDALHIQVGSGYRPSANEEFMNDEQLAYFENQIQQLNGKFFIQNNEGFTLTFEIPYKSAL